MMDGKANLTRKIGAENRKQNEQANTWKCACIPDAPPPPASLQPLSFAPSAIPTCCHTSPHLTYDAGAFPLSPTLSNKTKDRNQTTHDYVCFGYGRRSAARSDLCLPSRLRPASARNCPLEPLPVELGNRQGRLGRFSTERARAHTHTRARAIPFQPRARTQGVASLFVSAKVIPKCGHCCGSAGQGQLRPRRTP